MINVSQMISLISSRNHPMDLHRMTAEEVYVEVKTNPEET